MQFNHITNWRREDINLDAIYETIWEESTYWQYKTQNNSELLTKADSFFDSIEVILQALGKPIDLTTIRLEIQKAKYYAELLKEYIFEEVRAKEFPEKPSRKNCMFLAPQQIDIREYAIKLGYNLSQKNIVVIETLEDSNLHFGDITLLNCNSHSHNQKTETARLYWQGTNNRDFNTEALYKGKFKISKNLEI